MEVTVIDFDAGIDHEYKIFYASYVHVLFVWNEGMYCEEFENMIQQLYCEAKGWA